MGAVADEMDASRERFESLRQAGPPGVVVAESLYSTPVDVADRLAERLGDCRRILEPSAGTGRMYLAARKRNPVAEIVLVELAPACAGELYRRTEGDSLSTLRQGDFLAMGADRLGTFDGILANPPFGRGLELQHIRHALTLLRPAGRLISIVAAGPKQRAFARECGADWTDLPAGTFRQETGCDVATAIVSIQT
ncbi:MAG: methyltransferase [Planctomycetia bacterium]